MNQMSDEQLNEIKEILHHSGDKVVMTKDLIIALNDFYFGMIKNIAIISYRNRWIHGN